jgi:hypothetical protein
MATVKKIKKAQSGDDIPSWASKVSSQIRAEQLNPKLGDIRRAKEDSTMASNVAKGRAIERTNKIKEGYKVEDRPSGSTVYTKQKNGGVTSKAKDGKWMQKAAASIKKRGTEGKCTPITKPGCTGKAKTLAKTFKKIAAKRKSK